MFQPNYGVGNTKNNLEGLLKRCTSSNIWRLMNSDAAAQRRIFGISLVLLKTQGHNLWDFYFFFVINLALPILRSTLPCCENEIINYSHVLWGTCPSWIFFLRSRFRQQLFFSLIFPCISGNLELSDTSMTCRQRREIDKAVAECMTDNSGWWQDLK